MMRGPPSVGVGRLISGWGHYLPSAGGMCTRLWRRWSYQRGLDGSSQVRQPFAPYPHGVREHLAAHVLVDFYTL